MNININYDIGQKVYIIENKRDKDRARVAEAYISEIALDKKGWHMHIKNTRYSLETKLVYLDRAEAEEYLEQLKSKTKR